MVGIDQILKVGGVFLLDSPPRPPSFFRSLGPANRARSSERALEYLGVSQNTDILQPVHIPVLFSRNMLEELSAVNDLIDGLVEGDGHPFPFSPFPALFRTLVIRYGS